MVLQALKTTGVRVATAQARRAGARRNMGGHAPAPEWTGIDKVVRGYFPQDYQCTYRRISYIQYGYGYETWRDSISMGKHTCYHVHSVWTTPEPGLGVDQGDPMHWKLEVHM